MKAPLNFVNVRRMAAVFGFIFLALGRPVFGAEPIYAAHSTAIPSQSLGGITPYQNVTPEIEKDDLGNIAKVTLPLKGPKSASLVWWYASHVKGRLTDWPKGETARVKIVVRSPSEVQLDVAVSLETSSGWANGTPVAGVKVPANTLTPVYVALPENPSGGIAKIRVTFSSSQSLPPLEITGLSAGSITDAVLTLPDETTWRTVNPVTISGRAAGKAGETVKIQVIDENKTVITTWSAPLNSEGAFTLQVDRSKLPLCQKLTLVPSAPGKTAAKGTYDFFTFPVLDSKKLLSRVAKQGRHLVLDGKPYAFMGVNYTPFMLGLSRKADHELVAKNFREMSEWGVTAIRVPLSMAMIQPAPGVFPDSPEYATVLRKAGLDARFFELLRYTVALGRHFNIRIVFDWHESMMDPYRYFTGGNVADKGTGKPGSPLAWLAMPESEYPKEDHPLFITMDNPRHQAALFDSTAWLAGAFKGEGAVLGYEVPYNEPHERMISNDKNWRWLTAQCALRVKQADPHALTFGMPSGWGHENVFISSTWLTPDLVDGMTPHFYVSNGPIPVRPDAKQRKYSYLAREVEPSLSLGLTALSLPYTAVDYPVYNGEGGGHGAESFLPDMPLNQATRIMIEAQLFQAYATGMAGYFEWTMWNNKFWSDTTLPNKPLFQRYAPLFNAGPVDFRKARVLFVQNPAAEHNANGHNFASVAFARAVLDLQLSPVHYMTDDQLIYTGQTMFSRGFEQVDASGEGLGSYKAIIIDTRNVDSRALAIVRGSGVPVLEFTQDNPIETAAIATFLEKSNLPLDRKTSKEFQVVQGPQHVAVYRRSEGSAARIYPLLEIDGKFNLIGEDGAVAFSGTAASLAGDGMAVNIPKWTGAIYKIAPAK
jgi:hypothetical protein